MESDHCRPVGKDSDAELVRAQKFWRQALDVVAIDFFVQAVELLVDVDVTFSLQFFQILDHLLIWLFALLLNCQRRLNRPESQFVQKANEMVFGNFVLDLRIEQSPEHVDGFLLVFIVFAENESQRQHVLNVVVASLENFFMAVIF